MTTIYDFNFKNSDGSVLPLQQYRNKLVLLVNTASKCGFTPQYAGLQQLWERYKDQGLIVLGVPSNDFANQEPAAIGEILCFTRDHYSVTFPLTEKNHVKGPDIHPCYQWIDQQVGFWGKPRWNFYKYLISPQGELLAWFPSFIKPESPRVINVIEKHLP
jgi:glutathione peroxidase